MISSIFQDKLIHDDRQPLLTAQIMGSTYGFFLPSPAFLAQLFIGLFISGIINSIFWIMIYKVVIPARERGYKWTCYLVGYVIVIPLNAFYPLHLLQYLDVQNKVLRFTIGSILPVLTFFHTLEAMYGFSPQGVESSLKDYLIYNASIFPIEYDDHGKKSDDRNDSSVSTPTPVKATSTSVKTTIKDSHKQIFIFGMFMSLFAYANQEPFHTITNGNEPGYNLQDMFDWKLTLNNFVGTVNFQLSLLAFSTVLALGPQLLFGIQTSYVMSNPMFTSRSVSDFWGSKWNMAIHGVLKRGVFKPMYSWTSSRYCAVLATFMMSGLFHEYLLYVTVSHPSQMVQPCYGKNTAFMMWNAMTITFEALLRPLIRKVVPKSTIQKIPTLLLSCYVLSTAMPIAHWFIHPYTKCGLFEDFHVAIPMIQKL